jgi:ABC-type Fe3+ transport system permease subunit
MKRRFSKAFGLVVLVLAVFAIVAPSAEARVSSGDGGGTVVQPVKVPVVRSQSNGFDWNYVWISLGAVSGACLLGAGVVRTRTRRVVFSS